MCRRAGYPGPGCPSLGARHSDLAPQGTGRGRHRVSRDSKPTAYFPAGFGIRCSALEYRRPGIPVGVDNALRQEVRHAGPGGRLEGGKQGIRTQCSRRQRSRHDGSVWSARPATQQPSPRAIVAAGNGNQPCLNTRPHRHVFFFFQRRPSRAPASFGAEVELLDVLLLAQGRRRCRA
jgi:hypothetical protein